MAPKNAMIMALFALGFLSIGTQIYLVREVMSQSGDNELIIGSVLGTWMFITGSGAALSWSRNINRFCSNLVPLLLVVTGMLPLLQVTGISLVKALLVPLGSMAGPIQTLAIIVAVTLPFGLLNGYLFARLSAEIKGVTPGGAYAWETIGSMASGALINFILLWITGVFTSLLILQGAYLVMILWYVYYMYSKRYFRLLAAITVVYLLMAGFCHPGDWTEQINFPGQQVITDKETPYGKVVITRRSDQLNFYENGMLLFSSGNAISNEENVHYAMVQNPAPGNILLVSGGFAGTLTEICKYKPEHVDYLEMNPALIAIATRFTRQLSLPAVHLHAIDARKFIRSCKNTYDIVLVNLPPPSTLQLNRYYSVEFFAEAKQAMRPGGVIALSLPGGADYLSEIEAAGGAVLWKTLKACFSNVIVIPGNRNYFIASDHPLSLHIPALIDQFGIPTSYVNKYYLDENQLIARAQGIMKLLAERAGDKNQDRGIAINSDLTPVAVWFHLSWWLGFHQVKMEWIVVIFGIILLLMVVTLNPLSAGLFTGSFTLVSLEIMLVMGVQILTGYLFQAIGAIIMVFMLGLAAGAGTATVSGHKATYRGYALLQSLLAVCAFCSPFVITWLADHSTGDWAILLILGLVAFLLSFMVGSEYRIATALSGFRGQMTITTNYSADMFGAAAGAMASSMFLLPAFGMIKTGILLAILNMTSAGILLAKRKRK